MIHVGLDLSITAAGVCVLAPGEHPRIAVVRSKPAGYAPGITGRRARLRDISLAILGFVFPDGKLDAADVRFLVEAPTYASSHQSGSQHDRAGSWWDVVGQLVDQGYSVVEVSNTTGKKFALGNGNPPNPKGQLMARAAQEMPGVDFHDDNGCDALWLAVLAEYKSDPDNGRVERLKYRDAAASAVPSH